VTEVASDGAAGTRKCQVQGVLVPGDQLLSVSGYTRVTELDSAHADSAVPTCRFIKHCVGPLHFVILRKNMITRLLTRSHVTVFKENVTDTVGVEMQCTKGDKHPHVTKVAAGSRASGHLKVGDVVVSITAATKKQTICVNATLGAKGNAALAACMFMSACLGPVTLECHRLKDKKARKASVAVLTQQAGPAHRAEDHDTEASVIAAGETHQNHDQSTADFLEDVGMAPDQLQVASICVGGKHA